MKIHKHNKDMSLSCQFFYVKVKQMHVLLPDSWLSNKLACDWRLG